MGVKMSKGLKYCKFCDELFFAKDKIYTYCSPSCKGAQRERQEKVDLFYKTINLIKGDTQKLLFEKSIEAVEAQNKDLPPSVMKIVIDVINEGYTLEKKVIKPL